MQGVIFNALEEFVLDRANMEVWNEVLDASQVESGGVYTAGMNYKDEEVLALASALCEALKIPLNEILRLFGEFLFSFLLSRGHVELNEYRNSQALLMELESVIHQDIKRVHPDAYTPLFEYIPLTENTGQLSYFSKRKLCMVAEGLLAGAANFFHQEVKIIQTECMHENFEKCRWDVTFS